MNFSVFSINRMWELGVMIQKQKLSWEDDAPKVDKLITVFIKIQNFDRKQYRLQRHSKEKLHIRYNLFICGLCLDKKTWDADYQVLK